MIVIRFQFSSPISIMKSNYNSLVKTMNTNMNTILSPIWNEYHLSSNALSSCCGWLASSLWSLLAWENTIWISLEFSWISLLWVLLAFLDQPIWYLQLRISNDSRSPLPYWPSKHLACQSHYWAARSLSREKWSLQEPFLTLTWMTLVDWSRWWTRNDE